jgi:hypothetical protein
LPGIFFLTFYFCLAQWLAQRQRVVHWWCIMSDLNMKTRYILLLPAFIIWAVCWKLNGFTTRCLKYHKLWNS